MTEMHDASQARATDSSAVLDDLLCFDLYATSRAMTAFYRPLLDRHGLTYPQYLVLVTVMRGGPSTIGDVGRALRLDHGTLTPLLRRMATRDLVVLQRDSDDARAVTVSLGRVGAGLEPAFEEVRCVVRDALGLDDEEVVALQRTLRTIAVHLGAQPGDLSVADPDAADDAAEPA